MTLRSIWAGSYFTWIHPLEPWPEDGSFDTWWSKAQHNFTNARATSFYRYLLPAFRDLYGVDFDRITPEQARELNDRIFENYKTDRWLQEVITERANIELMVIDSYWARLACTTDYPFTVALCNVTSVVRGFHSSEFSDPLDDPYAFAKQHDLDVDSLDDYVAVLDHLLAEAKKKGAICLKTTLAYNRTLRFENVSKEQAAKAFGRPRSELSEQEIKDFEDYIMWRLVELSAKHDLPFQIHTGQARIQGSNPMLLVDLIEANPEDEVHPVSRRVPLGGRDGSDRHALSQRLDRLLLAAHLELHDGQTSLSGVAGGVSRRTGSCGDRIRARPKESTVPRSSRDSAWPRRWRRR